MSPQISTSPPIHIPIPSLSSRPQSTDEEKIEDWNDSVHELFEWVGMALLESQRYDQHHIYYIVHKSMVGSRLEVNDRPDPYIAVYTPPQPTRMGSVTHIQWRGLVVSTVVQSIVDAAM